MKGEGKREKAKAKGWKAEGGRRKGEGERWKALRSSVRPFGRMT